MSEVTGPAYKPNLPPEDQFNKDAQVDTTDKEINKEKDYETKKDVATGSGGAPMALGNVQHQDSISKANAPGSVNQDTAIHEIVKDSSRTVKNDNPT